MRNYKFAMEQFITWYRSERRLALNRTVVLRFRLYLESSSVGGAGVCLHPVTCQKIALPAMRRTIERKSRFIVGEFLSRGSISRGSVSTAQAWFQKLFAPPGALSPGRTEVSGAQSEPAPTQDR